MPITATKKYTKTPTKQPFQAHTIPLGNGVDFPVESEGDLHFVEWMIAESKAGRASLPTRNATIRPKILDDDKFPKSKREDWWVDYEYAHSDRF